MRDLLVTAATLRQPLLACLLMASVTISACGDDSVGADVSADTSADTSTPGDTVADDTATGDTVASDTAASDTAAGDTAAGDTAASDTAAGDTAAGDTEAGDADDTDDGGNSCTHRCDCEQGFGCVDGACTLANPAVFCCDNADCPSGEACVSGDDSSGICAIGGSVLAGDLIINEVLTDGSVDGDPNGDGNSPDPVGDEFVELLNVSSGALDLSDVTISESNFPTLPRHTFPTGFTLGSGKAVVIFGGGTAPDDTLTTTFMTAINGDPGTPLGLHLDNAGDTVLLLDANQTLIAEFAYGPGTSLTAVTDQSFTRSPDLTGDFAAHTTAAGDDSARFSPGTKLDGTSF